MSEMDIRVLIMKNSVINIINKQVACKIEHHIGKCLQNQFFVNTVMYFSRYLQKRIIKITTLSHRHNVEIFV